MYHRSSIHEPGGARRCVWFIVIQFSIGIYPDRFSFRFLWVSGLQHIPVRFLVHILSSNYAQAIVSTETKFSLLRGDAQYFPSYGIVI